MLFPVIGLSQIMYDPQDLYDSPGGLFDEDIKVSNLMKKLENLSYQEKLTLI